MKTFISVLAALLVAMTIGYVLYDHIQWAHKKAAIESEINNAVEKAADVTGSGRESYSDLREALSRVHESRRALMFHFAQKTLPLSPSERHLAADNQAALAEDWKRCREDDLKAIAEADSETDSGAKDFQVACRQRFIRDVEKNTPFSDSDKALSSQMGFKAGLVQPSR